LKINAPPERVPKKCGKISLKNSIQIFDENILKHRKVKMKREECDGRFSTGIATAEGNMTKLLVQDSVTVNQTVGCSTSLGQKTDSVRSLSLSHMMEIRRSWILINLKINAPPERVPKKCGKISLKNSIQIFGENILKQACKTCGPRAACGPLQAHLQPAQRVL